MNTSPANNRVKVLFILPALTAGGAERVLITLMNSIDRTRFEPEFLTVSDDGPLKDLIDTSIPYHSLHGQRVSRAIFKLHKKIKEVKPDVVMSTMAHLNFVVLLQKPFFPKTSFIVREAITPSFYRKEHPKLMPLIYTAYKLFYPYADMVISPANEIIRDFKDTFGMVCKNHECLYNPVNFKLIRANESEKRDISEERRNTVHFIAAGRLHPQKGLDRLIEKLPELKMPYDWRLTILGEGPERENLEALIAKHSLQDKISMPGLEKNPWPFFAHADCFVLPSRFEGLPNVTLESLSCGTPVIASYESGGIQEIADRADGHIQVTRDMDEFITKMGAVKPNPSEQFKASLLPGDFQMKTVIDRFEGLIARVV